MALRTFDTARMHTSMARTQRSQTEGSSKQGHTHTHRATPAANVGGFRPRPSRLTGLRTHATSSSSSERESVCNASRRFAVCREHARTNHTSYLHFAFLGRTILCAVWRPASLTTGLRMRHLLMCMLLCGAARARARYLFG